MVDGTFITNFRAKYDLNQTELGEMLGLVRQSISRMERSEQIPDYLPLALAELGRRIVAAREEAEAEAEAAKKAKKK